MQRSFTPAALLVAAVPALALAVAPPPTVAARAHPAASAHANAAAAEAGAARMEACGNLSGAMLAALGRNDFKAATANFDTAMETRLDATKLEAAWTSVTAQVGKLLSLGTPQAVMYQTTPVITTTLRFEHGSLAAQVACGHDGKIDGFHVRSVASGP